MAIRWHKKFIKSAGAQNAIAFLAASYLRLVYGTTRWQDQGFENIQPYWNENRPMIAVFWHNRLLLPPLGWRSKIPFYMLISGHADGRIIAKTIAHFALNTIAGSKSSGGSAALKGLLNVLKKGGSVGLTPDGPRGPRFEVSEGVIHIARLSKCDILPITCGVSRRKILGSWDRFLVPFPFSKGVVKWGEPFKVGDFPKETPISDICQALTQHMLDECDAVDRTCGHEPLR